MNLTVHESAELFPMLDDAELDKLATDIAKNGQIEPIVVFDRKILDGRNRLEACRRARVEPKLRELEACDSPTAFVISANLHRRHLTPMLRSACAVDALPLFRAEAEARQRLGKSKDGEAGGRGRKKPVSQTGTEVLEGPATESGNDHVRPVRATDEAAHAFHAGEHAVAALAQVKQRAPEVFAAAKSGLIANVVDVVRIGRLEPEARAEVLTAISSGTEPRQAIADCVRADRIERVAQISAHSAHRDQPFRVIVITAFASS